MIKVRAVNTLTLTYSRNNRLMMRVWVPNSLMNLSFGHTLEELPRASRNDARHSNVRVINSNLDSLTSAQNSSAIDYLRTLWILGWMQAVGKICVQSQRHNFQRNDWPHSYDVKITHMPSQSAPTVLVLKTWTWKKQVAKNRVIVI